MVEPNRHEFTLLGSSAFEAVRQMLSRYRFTKEIGSFSKNSDGDCRIAELTNQRSLNRVSIATPHTSHTKERNNPLAFVRLKKNEQERRQCEDLRLL
jgi:hypothetical protein